MHPDCLHGIAREKREVKCEHCGAECYGQRLYGLCKECLKGAYSAFIGGMTAGERLSEFERITESYCIHCGDEQPEYRYCQCENDE